MEKGEEKEKEKRKKEKKKRREKLQLLSRISDYQTIDFHRSKKESSSMQRELRIETKIRVFTKLLDVGVFLLYGLILV